MVNKVIFFSENTLGFNFEYFYGKSSSNKSKTINASHISGVNYDLYLDNSTYNASIYNNNASLINEIKENIKYIHISSKEISTDVLFNASLTDSHTDYNTFSASLIQGDPSVITPGTGVNITFDLTRNIAGSGGGGGVPGGSDKQIQFNNNGSFGGSSNLTFNNDILTINGSLVSNNLNVSNNLVVDGNVTFNGSTTEIKSENVVKTDPLLKLNSSLTDSETNTKDTGLILNRGSEDNVFIGWDESEDKIAFGLGSFTGDENGYLNISPANVYGNNASFTSGSFTTLETYDLIVTNEIDGTLTQTINTDNNSFQTGAALYISGSLTNDSKFRVSLANANNSSTMPVIGLKSDNNKAVTYGLLKNISSSVFDSTNASYEAGQTIYASASHSGSLTNVKPGDNSDLIQNIGILKKYDSNNSAIFITGIGRSNDIPNASLVNYSDIQYIYGKNSNDRFIMASTANISGVSASFISGSFTNISGNISNTTGYNASALTGTITNSQLANSSVTITAGSGLTGGGEVSLGSSKTLNIGAGTGIDVAEDAISVDVSDFMLNGVDNRVLTATGTDAMQAEANLTFDGTTLNISGSLQLDSVSISTIQTSSESFTDDDISLMTSAAIQDKITSYGYTTNNGTVTSVTGTGSVNGLTLSGNVINSGNLTLGGTLTIDNSVWNGEDLSVLNGGTGASSLTQDAILRGNGTGAVTADSNLKFNGTTLDVTGNIHLPDNKKIYIGNSNDLSIYHNGSNSHIDELGTGDLVISATHLRLRSGSNTETFLLGTENHSVELYYNGSKTFETNASGITVTDVNNNTGTVTGNLTGNITGTVSSLSNHDTDTLSEGSTNLYYTNARSRGAISVNDSAGDGSLAYDSSTGVITYTGPSASEVRAHFSSGTGVTYSNGEISIGQAVGTGNDVTFNNVTSSLTGNVTGNADTATLATTVTVTDSSTNSDFPVVFQNGSNSLLDDTGSFTYNPSNSNLTIKSGNASNGKALLTMISDNAGDLGDGYQIESLNGILTISSDHATSASYSCPIIEFSGNSVSASRTTKINGELHVTEDITAFYTSDKRYKENLKNISEPNEKIKKINGYEFDWNEKHNTYKGQHDVGVIAQEIEEVLPEVVTTRENGYKAVRYDKIISLLIESNKDLLRRVEELESKLS